jgi:hypothetical protein
MKTSAPSYGTTVPENGERPSSSRWRAQPPSGRLPVTTVTPPPSLTVPSGSLICLSGETIIRTGRSYRYPCLSTLYRNRATCLPFQLQDLVLQKLFRGDTAVSKEIRGIAITLAAMLLFALMDAVSKYLSTRYPTPQIQSLLTLPSALAAVLSRAPAGDRDRPGHLGVRAAAAGRRACRARTDPACGNRSVGAFAGRTRQSSAVGGGSRRLLRGADRPSAWT